MYIMYVDESGDSGLINSPTRYFALSGIIVHESRWRDLHDHLLAFRKTLKGVYGLPVRTEIHSSEYVRSPPAPGISKNQRLSILRNQLDELAKIDFISITNVMVDKTGKAADYDVFDNAWRALLQRFDNTIGYGNFPGGHKADKGLVITDNTEGEKLRRLIRRIGAYNPVPNQQHAGPGYRDIPMVRIVEDAFGKDSRDSYMIQAADVCAYFLLQKHAPCAYIKKRGAVHYLNRLDSILNKRASQFNGFGIVVL
ncbi:MAG: DUF3800 domain-containing protein [Caulobacter sp.]|nr:DUF3800 domain-containing protein [Caulobacter sp.]